MKFESRPVQGPQKPIKRLNPGYVARRRRRILKAAIGVVGIASMALAFVVVDRPITVHPIADAGLAVARPDASTDATTAALPVRPVYRHSVVPGGVRSQEEIAAVMERDPVVKAHYQAINPVLMRNERLEKPILAHVSYRLGDKVYWTKKPVPLPANEPIMTDGQNSIRERCGNLISMEPLAPSSEEEPPLPSFDLLMDPMEFNWQPLHYTPPGKPFKPAFTPFNIPPPPPIMGPRGVPRTTPETPNVTTHTVEVPLPVPEPNTLMLVGLGAAAAAAHYLRKRRRK